MYYSGLSEYDTINGEGFRVSLFVSGCELHCSHCHNKKTWNPTFGTKYTKEIEDKILYYLSKDYISGLSLLGGDPLYPSNRKEILNLILRVKDKFPNKSIYLWTGYTLEQLQEMKDNNINSILSNIDVLIDGPFIQEKKDLTLSLRGSSNQRILKKNIDF